MSDVTITAAAAQKVYALMVEESNLDLKLRVHIVAYNDDAVGSVEDILIVRSPVIANLSTPRFLAPSDIARLDLVLHNIVIVLLCHQ